MGIIYGNQLLNEAVFFLSNQGKDIKKQVKEIIKENNPKYSLTNRLMKIGVKYDDAQVKKISSELEKIFDHVSISPMIRSIVYYSSGGGADIYSKKIIGTKGNYVYNFSINFEMTNASLGTAIREVSLDKYNMSKEFIEFVIDNAGDSVISFGKNHYKTDGDNKSLFNKVQSKFGKTYDINSNGKGKVIIKNI